MDAQYLQPSTDKQVLICDLRIAIKLGLDSRIITFCQWYAFSVKFVHFRLDWIVRIRSYKMDQCRRRARIGIRIPIKIRRIYQ